MAVEAVAVATAAENVGAMAVVAVASVAEAPWPPERQEPADAGSFFGLRPSQSRTNKVTKGSGPT